MPHKCSVVKCRAGYTNGPVRPMFSFPSKTDLRQRWIQFINREDFSVTSSSRICIDHFESKYILRHLYNTRLNMSMNPIPTIHHSSILKSQATVPKSIRKPPTKRVVQSDQLPLFRDQFRCADIEDVVKYINTAREYQNFTHCITESGVTTYRVEINSGIAQVKECIHITSDLHVKLSFQSSSIPLPDYIAKSANSKITSLDMLTNLPNYCRNFTHNFDTEPVKELLHLSTYHPKSCKYSSRVIRFALQLRYTYHAAYRFLHHHIPLPSERLSRNLKSESIDSISALCKLRDEGFSGNDVVLLLDEMHLQQQVQFDGRDLIGCNENLEMFKSILCFMVVSLKKSIPCISGFQPGFRD